jgi:hypothetical protein
MQSKDEVGAPPLSERKSDRARMPASVGAFRATARLESATADPLGLTNSALSASQDP